MDGSNNNIWWKVIFTNGTTTSVPDRRIIDLVTTEKDMIQSMTRREEANNENTPNTRQIHR